MNNLELYAQQQAIIDNASEEMERLAALIRAEVEKSGEQNGFGLVAKFKPGRKKTDHKMAALAADAGDELIKKHTTIKTTSSTAWAKVTKELGCDVATFTTQEEPSFVIQKA